MSPKKMLVIGLLVGFIAGAAAGFFFVGSCMKSFMSEGYSASIIADVGQDTLKLRILRKGEQAPVIQSLEDDLDAKILLMSDLYPSLSSHLQSCADGAFNYAKKYRNEYSWKSGNGEFDKLIADVFTKGLVK